MSEECQYESISTVSFGGDANGEKTRVWPARRSTGDPPTPTPWPVPAQVPPAPLACREALCTLTAKDR